MILNNRYKIIDKIKGDILLGIDTITDKKVVIKKNRYSGKGYSLELEVLKQINHENLPVLLDCFFIDSDEYIVTMYFEGETLTKILETRSISEVECIEYVYKLILAVEYLHNFAGGIAHTDISSENIIINDRSHLVLVDFGDAFLINNSEVDIFNSSGTIGYVAPEKFLYPEMVNWQTDIYSIGAVIKQILDKNKHIYSIELQLILKKAMAIELRDRYLNINQLKQDLELII